MESLKSSELVFNNIRLLKSYKVFLNQNHKILFRYVDLLMKYIPKKYHRYFEIDEFFYFIFLNHYK
jgi:hypothetical protein